MDERLTHLMFQAGGGGGGGGGGPKLCCANLVKNIFVPYTHLKTW